MLYKLCHNLIKFYFKVVLLLIPNGSHGKALSGSHPSSRSIFTSMLKSTCCHTSSALCSNSLCLGRLFPPPPTHCLDRCLPTSLYYGHFATFTNPTLFTLFWSIKASQSTNSVGSMNENSQNCTHRALPHTLTLTLCMGNILPRTHNTPVSKPFLSDTSQEHKIEVCFFQ